MVSERAETKTGGREASTGFIPGDYSLAVGMPQTPAPKGWKWSKLTDLARLESGHTPSRKYPEYWDGGVCWVGIRDATANHGQTIYDTNQHASELGIKNSSARLLPKNTVCLSRTASVGYVIVMGKEMATSQDFVNWVCSKDLDNQFLKYILISENRSFLRFASGTTHQTIYFPEVKAFHICHPPLPEQKAIAHILGSLDDKIELNRRMNATLEGMAQALFKSWFVDFDPVIDNALVAGNPIPDELADRAEVRRQALANGTANREAAKAFPNSFHETVELGWIPKGWDVQPLGEHLDVLETGRRPKGGVSSYASGVPSVGAESIFGIGLFDFGKLKFVPEEFFEKMNSGKVESYDVLLYKDGGKPGEFKPRSGMYGEGFPFKSFGINEHVFRMRSSSLGQAFLYYQVSSERVFHHLAVRGGKAAIPGINQKEVNSVDFLIPQEDVRETFNNFSQPIFEKILKTANQSRMLEIVRDTLLPKLISGDLRIEKAQKIIEKEMQ